METAGIYASSNSARPIMLGTFYIHIKLVSLKSGYSRIYSESLRAGRSEDRIPLGFQIFRTHPDPVLGYTQPTCGMGNGSLSRGCKAIGA